MSDATALRMEMFGGRWARGVVAQRAFVAERLARINAAFDDEVGVAQNGFQFGQDAFQVSANSEQIQVRENLR